MNENNIRTEILQIKKKLLAFADDHGANDKGFTLKLNPVAHFEDNDNYPLDFQIFLEEIGELYLGWNDYEVIQIQTPFPLENVEKGSEEAENLSLISTFIGGQDKYMNRPITEFEVFSNEVCSYVMYCFDITKKPYSIVTEEYETKYSSFVDWFKITMNDQIDYAYQIKNYF